MKKQKYKYRIILILVIFFGIMMPNYSNAAITVGQVKNVKAVSRTTTSINIKWNKVSRASGYSVYVYNNEKKVYKLYKNTTKTTLNIKKLLSAQTYKIKIRAYRKIRGKKYYGKYSSVLKNATTPGVPKNIVTKSRTDSTVKIAWDKVERASGYRVYVYNYDAKKYDTYGETTKNNIEIKKLKSAKKYSMKIKAYKKKDNSKYLGTASNKEYIITAPEKVKGIKVSYFKDETAKISWKEIGEGVKYKIYLYNDTTGKWDLCQDVNTTSTIIENLDMSKSYKIKMRAYRKYDNNEYMGEESNIVIISVERKGIDVSRHQGTIDWQKVKDSGIQFAMLRIGNRGNDVGKLYYDKTFEYNLRKAKELDIEVGLYFYSCALNEKEAIEEAKWTIDKLKELGVEKMCEYIAYDFEEYGVHRTSKITKAQVDKNNIEFLKYVKNSGYKPVLYANKYYLTTILDTEKILNEVPSCKVWLAQYNSKVTYEGRYDMWQYSSTGRVDGIEGNVDMDIIYF